MRSHRVFGVALKVVTVLVVLASTHAYGADSDYKEREAIATRIVGNRMFQEAFMPAFLEAAAADLGTVEEGKKGTLSMVFNMSMISAFALAFTADELSVLEPVYTTSAGISAVGKMRNLYQGFRMDLKRNWAVYGH